MMQIFTNTQVCFTIWLKLPDAIETYFDKKTLPEAQRTQGIESITQIIPTAEAC